jgi:hypothetical protein
MAALLGVITAKMFGFAGIGSFIAGFFLSSKKSLLLVVSVLAAIETLILKLWLHSGFFGILPTFIFALIGAGIMGGIAYVIAQKRRIKKGVNS